MTGLKPLVNISKRVANHMKFAGRDSINTLTPVKSAFDGFKFAPLKKDTLTLNPQPKKYTSQAEKLKDFYQSKGVPYLLPSETWSDKKIFDTVKLVGKEIDKLIKMKALNKKTLQDAIEKFAPENKGKIIIKDFQDLKKDFEAQGYSKSAIKDYLKTSSAVTDPTNEGTSIYLKFEELNKNNYSVTGFKIDAEHEIKHWFGESKTYDYKRFGVDE